MGMVINPYRFAAPPPPAGDPSALSANWRSPSISLSGGNLTATKDATSDVASVGSIDAKDTGKWYFEATVDSLGTGAAFTRVIVGVGHANYNTQAGETIPTGVVGYGHRIVTGVPNGTIFEAGTTSGSTLGSPWSAGDVISVAVDADSRTVKFARNGGTYTTDYSIGGTLPIMPVIRLYAATAALTLNFGGTSFAHSPPSGFSAWEENANYEGRYWRLQAFLGAGGGQSFNEVNFRATVGGSNISRSGGTATASTSFSGTFLPANAVDGNNSTFWSSNAEQDSAWWQFDFGSATTVREVSITKRSSSTQAFRQGAIQYSSDGAKWFPARQVVQTWNSAQETREFAVCDG